jgi:Domain of unknown function (DUF5666)
MQHMQQVFSGRVRAAFIGGGATLMLAMAGLAGPALAADQSTTAAAAPQALSAHTHQLHGIVKAAPPSGATTFTVTTERHGDVTVSFTATTANGVGHGRGKARAYELAKIADLKADERLVVQGHTSADGKTFVARRVHVLPAKGGANGTAHMIGIVTSANASSLTLKLADGTSQTVAISADTKIRPEGKTVADLTAGTKVTVVSKNGTATGIVVGAA